MPWEQGIRVTLGKKLTLMNEGVYLKLPLVHKVYVQEKRLRVMSMPMQTVTTADGHPITISLAVGYSIKDIVRLYNTLVLLMYVLASAFDASHRCSQVTIV